MIIGGGGVNGDNFEEVKEHGIAVINFFKEAFIPFEMDREG